MRKGRQIGRGRERQRRRESEKERAREKKRRGSRYYVCTLDHVEESEDSHSSLDISI